MKFILGLLFLTFLITPQAFPISILFDNTKDEQAGNADWIIDDNQPIPLPANPASEEDWQGGISAWGFSLWGEDFSVHTLPPDSSITYGDSSNSMDLSNYDLFIVPEPQLFFSSSEKMAILGYVHDGGSLFMVANHNASDRNHNGIYDDSPRVWNDLGIDTCFGIHFNITGEPHNTITQTSGNVDTATGDPIINGQWGRANSLAFHGGTTMVLYPDKNHTVRGHIWMEEAAQANYDVMLVTCRYGQGRVVSIGDSSPADDGTGTPGDDLYNGWDEASDRVIFLNSCYWLLEDALSVTSNFPATSQRRQIHYANYPNPFNSSTTISFSLSQPEMVTLKVYNPLGERIRTLCHGVKGEGKVVWDGRNWRGEELASGIYLGCLRVGEERYWLKLVLIR